MSAEEYLVERVKLLEEKELNLIELEKANDALEKSNSELKNENEFLKKLLERICDGAIVYDTLKQITFNNLDFVEFNESILYIKKIISKKGN